MSSNQKDITFLTSAKADPQMDSEKAHVAYQPDAPSTVFPSSQSTSFTHSGRRRRTSLKSHPQGLAGSHCFKCHPSQSFATRRRSLLHHGIRHVHSFFSCFNIVILFLTIVNDVDNSPWFNIAPSETAGWVVLDIRVARHRYPSLGIQFQQQTSSVKETFNL